MDAHDVLDLYERYERRTFLAHKREYERAAQRAGRR